MEILTADFLGGATTTTGLPAHSFAEIAFLGRSNVGKSTLINRLVKRKNIARTSATPGRTQCINLFSVRIRDEALVCRDIVIADLPGYGYAKVSQAKRHELQATIENYLSKRKELIALCLLSDARRGPEIEEVELYELAFRGNCHVIPILTKGDKLAQSERQRAKDKAAAAYHLSAADIVLCGQALPLDELWLRLKLLIAL